MCDTTIIYYTSNREKEWFEKKICDSLLAAKGNLPLISVSQKPMELGTNICVGNVGAKKQHIYRQLLIGAESATTQFVCTAESDFLYAPEYFAFEPEYTDTFYLARPCWVVMARRGNARTAGLKHDYSDHPLVVGRETLIARIHEMFAGVEEYWSDAWENTRNHPYVADPSEVKAQMFEAGIGSVTFKTDENMHRGSYTIKSTKTRHIPGWGEVAELLKKYQGTE